MKRKKSAFLRDLKKNRVKWLMLLPAAIVVILMCYIPMGGIVLAFKEYNYHDGIFGSPWVGFKNFEYFFQSGKAWSVTRNTILYNVAFLCVNTFLQITCAILLSELAGKWFKRITQSESIEHKITHPSARSQHQDTFVIILGPASGLYIILSFIELLVLRHLIKYVCTHHGGHHTVGV